MGHFTEPLRALHVWVLRPCYSNPVWSTVLSSVLLVRKQQLIVLQAARSFPFRGETRFIPVRIIKTTSSYFSTVQKTHKQNHYLPLYLSLFFFTLIQLLWNYKLNLTTDPKFESVAGEVCKSTIGEVSKTKCTLAYFLNGFHVGIEMLTVRGCVLLLALHCEEMGVAGE